MESLDLDKYGYTYGFYQCSLESDDSKYTSNEEDHKSRIIST